MYTMFFIIFFEKKLDLPDLSPDRYSLETSAYIQKMSLWLLECALEENCLPDIVYRIIDNNPCK